MPTTTEKKIVKFEVIDHGYDGAQYFQGCGTAFTDYDNVVTGAGSNQAEAYADALEQIASNHDLTDAAYERLKRHGNAHYFRTRIYKDDLEAMKAPESEWYYYLSIRFNLG